MLLRIIKNLKKKIMKNYQIYCHFENSIEHTKYLNYNMSKHYIVSRINYHKVYLFKVPPESTLQFDKGILLKFYR